MLQRLSAEPHTAAVVACSLITDRTALWTDCALEFCNVAVVISHTFALQLTKSIPYQKPQNPVNFKAACIFYVERITQPVHGSS